MTTVSTALSLQNQPSRSVHRQILPLVRTGRQPIATKAFVGALDYALITETSCTAVRRLWPFPTSQAWMPQGGLFKTRPRHTPLGNLAVIIDCETPSSLPAQ